MNKVILIGRLVKDPDIRLTQGATPTCIARYTLAVDRKYSNGADKATDYIPCVAIGKSGEHAEKWFRKGMKIAVEGRIQTGKYENKEGQTVYTTDVFVESQEFCEPKQKTETAPSDGFVPAGDLSGDGLPFA